MRPRKRSWKNRPHEPVTRRVAALMVSGMAERKTVSPGSPAGIRAQKDGVEQRAYVGTEHDLEDLLHDADSIYNGAAIRNNINDSKEI